MERAKPPPHIDYADIFTWTNHGKAVRGGMWSLGLNGAIGDAATHQLGPLGPIFGGWSPLDLLSGSRWVLGKDYTIWFGFSLLLLSFGPYFTCLWASLFWACVEWFLSFVLLHIFSPFICISINTLLQMNKRWNSWNSLVINPNSKFGVYFSEFYASVGG